MTATHEVTSFDMYGTTADTFPDTAIPERSSENSAERISQYVDVLTAEATSIRSNKADYYDTCGRVRGAKAAVAAALTTGLATAGEITLAAHDAAPVPNLIGACSTAGVVLGGGVLWRC